MSDSDISPILPNEENHNCDSHPTGVGSSLEDQLNGLHVNQPVDEQVDEPVDESVDKPVDKPVDESVNEPVGIPASYSERNAFWKWFKDQPNPKTGNMIEQWNRSKERRYWLSIEHTQRRVIGKPTSQMNGRDIPDLKTADGIAQAKKDALEILQNIEKENPHIKGMIQGSLTYSTEHPINDIDLLIIVNCKTLMDQIDYNITRRVHEIYGNNCFFGKSGGGLYFDFNCDSSSYDSRLLKGFDKRGHHFMDILIVREEEFEYLQQPQMWHECLIQTSDGEYGFKQGYKLPCSPTEIKEMLNMGLAVAINGPDTEAREARLRKAALGKSLSITLAEDIVRRHFITEATTWNESNWNNLKFYSSRECDLINISNAEETFHFVVNLIRTSSLISVTNVIQMILQSDLIKHDNGSEKNQHVQTRIEMCASIREFTTANHSTWLKDKIKSLQNEETINPQTVAMLKQEQKFLNDVTSVDFSTTAHQPKPPNESSLERSGYDDEYLIRHKIFEESRQLKSSFVNTLLELLESLNDAITFDDKYNQLNYSYEIHNTWNTRFMYYIKENQITDDSDDSDDSNGDDSNGDDSNGDDSNGDDSDDNDDSNYGVVSRVILYPHLIIW